MDVMYCKVDAVKAEKYCLHKITDRLSGLFFLFFMQRVSLYEKFNESSFLYKKVL